VSEPMTFEEVEALYSLAVASGDEVLVAALTEVKRGRQKCLDLVRELCDLRYELGETTRHRDWLETVILPPLREGNKILNEQATKVLGVIRDPAIWPDDKVDQIEEMLTFSDEELAE
jgi:hypothetical protein